MVSCQAEQGGLMNVHVLSIVWAWAINQTNTPNPANCWRAEYAALCVGMGLFQLKNLCQHADCVWM